MTKRGVAARVGTYLGPGAFRAKDAAKTAKARQDGPLPPRCRHCRRSWDITFINQIPHCSEHSAHCDNECGRSDR